MITTLFNLHEMQTNNGVVTIEFYAGDIFDIYSDILVLSAFKDSFSPVPGTTWGYFNQKTGFDFYKYIDSSSPGISENIVKFNLPSNKYCSRLYAIEMLDLRKNSNGFTEALVKHRYRDFIRLLESVSEPGVETLSLPLLGTGNQGISYEVSVNALFSVLNELSNTGINTIRVFAWNFQSIGILNQKINSILSRPESANTGLLQAAIDEIYEQYNYELKSAGPIRLLEIVSLTKAPHSSFTIYGISGRKFAESFCKDLLYKAAQSASIVGITLDGMIKQIMADKLIDRPYVISYLRLLQSYGNLAAHEGTVKLNHQDAAAIIIAIVRINDYWMQIAK